jgi:hypothetical protein
MLGTVLKSFSRINQLIFAIFKLQGVVPDLLPLVLREHALLLGRPSVHRTQAG